VSKTHRNGGQPGETTLLHLAGAMDFPTASEVLMDAPTATQRAALAADLRLKKYRMAMPPRTGSYGKTLQAHDDAVPTGRRQLLVTV
jgi:hypothetical protein